MDAKSVSSRYGEISLAMNKILFFVADISVVGYTIALIQGAKVKKIKEKAGKDRAS
jgi:hypothetical protein